MSLDRLPSAVAGVLATWLDVHDRLAPGVVEGLYVVGSAALDDWRATSDVDVVAFTADPTDPGSVDALRAAHDRFRSEIDSPDVDGPFLGWADVTSPPVPLQRPWTLAGEFRFDAECFEINPVVWYTLAVRSIAVRGPASSELAVSLDASERDAWVRTNLETYWRGVRSEIAAVLDQQPDREEFPAEMTAWCVLGVARMAYTLETGDVAAKTAAGEWALERYPGHGDVIRRALAVRSGEADDVVDRSVVRAVVSWMGAIAS